MALEGAGGRVRGDRVSRTRGTQREIEGNPGCERGGGSHFVRGGPFRPRGPLVVQRHFGAELLRDRAREPRGGSKVLRERAKLLCERAGELRGGSKVLCEGGRGQRRRYGEIRARRQAGSAVRLDIAVAHAGVAWTQSRTKNRVELADASEYRLVAAVGCAWGRRPRALA